jgi:hypothetical protein
MNDDDHLRRIVQKYAEPGVITFAIYLRIHLPEGPKGGEGQAVPWLAIHRRVAAGPKSHSDPPPSGSRFDRQYVGDRPSARALQSVKRPPRQALR